MNTSYKIIFDNKLKGQNYWIYLNNILDYVFYSFIIMLRIYIYAQDSNKVFEHLVYYE